MYIVELFYKLKEKLKKQKEKTPETPMEEEEVSCEHIFVPIDSTNTILGCNKCGFLIHVNPEDLKKKNIFKK